MLQNYYSVYDSLAKGYLPPFIALTDGEATRIFQAALTDGETKFAKTPQDYSLYHVGDFDPGAGLMTGTREPVLIISALDALRNFRSMEMAINKTLQYEEKTNEE